MKFDNRKEIEFTEVVGPFHHERQKSSLEVDASTNKVSTLDVTFVPKPSSKRCCARWHQLYAALAATTSAAGLGCVFAYTATALPDLRNAKPFGEITSSQETWIGPLALLGAVVACPIAGFLIDGIGRRKTIVWLMPLFLSGWFVIGLAQNIWMIYIGRFITGFCGGSITLAIPVFLAEVSEVDIRGTLTSFIDMMITVGILYIYLIGTYASWQTQAFACGALPLLCQILMFIVPESPRFLLQRGDTTNARKSLSWFRNSTFEQIEEEFSKLLGSVTESQDKGGSWKDVFKVPVLKPIGIGMGLMFIQQCCGILPITAYTVDIFHSAGTDINDNLSTNIVGVIQVMATITSALLVDRYGRRLLLLLSTGFMTTSMCGMSSFFYMKNRHNYPVNQFSPLDYLGWLPLTSLLIYVVAFSIGVGPISWLYMGEIIPNHVRGKGCGIVTITSWSLSFAMTLGFGGLMATVGEDVGYGIFGAVSLIGSVFIYFCLPETKGRTLDEIQILFTKNNNIKNNLTEDL